MRQSKSLAILWLIIAMTAGVQTARADFLRGRVVDADTKEGLPEASIKYTEKYGENSYGIQTVKADSTGVFTFLAHGRGTIEVSMLGYYPKTKNVMALSSGMKDTIDIGTIELKMSEQLLKAVEVTGHARRFTVRGDTIVFNPDAFHLQEGARLDELIRQLPGVQVGSDGKMSWNGKPIRLTMDGESLFGGSDLVNKLPVEAVQDIKAYNKASDYKERTGRNDGEEDMVLDLTIKPGFLDKWYGDMTAGYQSPEYYEAEVGLNRLSKTDPVMVFADANNIAKRHRRYQGGWSRGESNGYETEHGASGGWQHNWAKTQGKREMKNNYSLSGGIAHDDSRSNSRSETENYFPDTAASLQSTDTYRRAHSLNPTFRGTLLWRPDTMNTVQTTAHVQYQDKQTHSRQTTEQQEYVGEGYVPTLSQLTNTRDDGTQLDVSINGRWSHLIRKGKVYGIDWRINYNDRKTDSWTERTITDRREGGSAPSVLSQYAQSPLSDLKTDWKVFYWHPMTKNWTLRTTYHTKYDHRRNRQDFMTDGAADAANSFSDRYNRMSHGLQISSDIDLKQLQLYPRIEGQWQRETQDYERGLLDTAAVRHRFLVEPSFRATWKLNKMTSIEAEYAFNTRQPELLQTIGYRDLTNPVFIQEGNPDLLDSHTHDISLKYGMILARQQTSLSAKVSYKTADHTTVNALSYDPATAVYTSRPETVKGRKSLDFILKYDQGLGDLFRLQNEFSLNVSRHYGYLTLLPTQTERTLNRQSNFHPKENLSVSYDNTWLKASVYTEIDATRLRFSASPKQNTTLWDNEMGLQMEATVGNFVFGSRLTESMRRGYAAQSMNRNRLLWDGDITWKILKNKARLKLEFEDILNNEDGYYSQQSAYQQTTSWSDFRHHYIGLSFTYHLDAKKKD